MNKIIHRPKKGLFRKAKNKLSIQVNGEHTRSVSKRHKSRTTSNEDYRRYKFIVGLLLIGWIVILVATYHGLQEYTEHRLTTRTETGISLVVEAMTYDDHGQEPFTAPPGWKFAIIRVRVRNESKNIFYFAPVLQTFITDETGHSYAMSPAALTDPIVAGPLAPGSQVVGSLSYLLPAGSQRPTLHFDSQ